MSAQAIVNPDDLERFARELKQFNLQLRDSTSRLQGQFAQLGDTWRDQEHHKFAQEFEQTMRVIHRFLQVADQHIPFLLRKAQRARDLRQEDDFGFSAFSMPGEEETPPSPAQQFPTILREGPDLGVHTLVWCDSYTNLTRTLDRRSLREFEMRVVFQMGAEDSANLIDTPAASKLGPYRALFYSEEEGRLDKFRPYALPSEEWLAWTGQRLRGKGAAHGG